MKKKVLVAMSGGVDSSVAALMLKEDGYDVIGITMEMVPVFIDRGKYSKHPVNDAIEVARILNIPHFVLDIRKKFNENIVKGFIKEYKNGRTPNPCIRCNRFIKFGILLEKAKEFGAEYLATGHYARIEYESSKNLYHLKKGIDREKDQSYFLYTMTQKQLKHTLMPLGDYTKPRVRKIAKEKGLPVHSKQGSQDICFIQNNNYGKFFKNFSKESIIPGQILDKYGNILGEHPGIIFYTIGQRRGMGISNRVPLYVLEIDIKNNSITVGERRDVYHNELIADETNFISVKIKNPTKVQAKIRYLNKASEALLTPLENNKVKVSFKRSQWAITPGQAVVFYDGDKVLGGGTIEKVLK